MIRECFRANTEIQFFRKSLESIGLNPDTLLDLSQPSQTPSPALVAEVEATAHAAEPTDGTLVDPTDKSEELEDARSKIHDQLERAKTWWWWILEFLPTPYREQIQKDEHYIWKHSWRYVSRD